MMFLTWLSQFAATGTCAQQGFFDFPTWYRYLLIANRMEVNDVTGRCELRDTFAIPDLALIGLALVDIALRVAALVAVAYVIYGGVQFVIAQGEADKVRKARQTIINALIGLAIALIATGLVAFIGTRIGHA